MKIRFSMLGFVTLVDHTKDVLAALGYPHLGFADT